MYRRIAQLNQNKILLINLIFFIILVRKNKSKQQKIRNNNKKTDRGIMKNLDDKDKRILEMLIEDSRRPYKEISETLTEEGIPLSESTVRKRVLKMQEDGVIEKFTIRICREDERCIIAFLTLIPKTELVMKDLLREAQILPQCEEVYFLAGECGILIKIKVPEITELDALIESFRARSDVKNVERVCVVLKSIKELPKSERIPL
jgi:Lrp/AsnC family leucine-responsive transcriptional regulator